MPKTHDERFVRMLQPMRFRRSIWRMRGPELIARTMSLPTPVGPTGELLQYHGRSDRHSKIACWSVMFDLMCTCSLLTKHIADGRVCFGINHKMSDFRMNREKSLDLVVCTPGTTAPGTKEPAGFRKLALDYSLQLDDGDRELLRGLPDLARAPVGSVRIALEAKACMTEHSKARPRLYDELNSSQQTVHGANVDCIAAGFVIVNLAASFRSPTRKGGVTRHKQPFVTKRVIEKLEQLPRRTTPGEDGFDALGIMVVECENEASVPVRIVSSPPAPSTSDVFFYDQMIRRVGQLYESRFAAV